MWYWMAHWEGLDDASGPWYLFWSGVGSDLGYLGIIAAVLRSRNCAVKPCRRIGRHRVDGHRVCSRHMPGGAPSHARILELHRRAEESE